MNFLMNVVAKVLANAITFLIAYAGYKLIK